MFKVHMHNLEKNLLHCAWSRRNDGDFYLKNGLCMFYVKDVRPFCTGERCAKVFKGHVHNFEKNLLHCAWSPDGTMVSAGSSDRNISSYHALVVQV